MQELRNQLTTLQPWSPTVISDRFNQPFLIATESDCCASIQYPTHGSGT
jgi:hypothetical protein